MTTPSTVLSGARREFVRAEIVDDPRRWSEVVQQLGGSLLQSWRWGEFKLRHGWRPRRVVVTENATPVIAAQVLLRNVGPMTVMYVPRGPVFGSPGDASWSAVTMEFDRIARGERAAIAFIEPEHPVQSRSMASGDLAWADSDVELQPLRTIKVPVDRDDEHILERMKSKTRYNIRLAGRRGVTVRVAEPREIVSFYEILAETSDRDEFGIHGIEYYDDMLDVFGESSALILAEHEGEIAAGAIVLQDEDEAIYMFGASTKKHQRHMPSHLLQFEAMRWARERGCRTYDLWGIPPTDEPPVDARDGALNVRSGLWGVYRFKQGFGGEIVSYPGVMERQYYPGLIKLWRMFRSGPGA